VPLTVSPYLSLPTATPLPYTYKSLSSTVPPSVTDTPAPSTSQDDGSQIRAKPAYVISPATGHSAHPDSIIESCRALQDHLNTLQQEAEATLKRWQEEMQRRDLAEKRRVAPGWLDVGESNRMLVPERIGTSSPAAVEVPAHSSATTSPTMSTVPTHTPDGGAELDRAFGGLSMR
jgi:hypothetical protein